MTAMIPLIVLVGTIPSDGISRPAKPLREQVTFSLTSDRGTYYVAEPIRLALTLKNVASEPVPGYFAISPMSPKAELRYRHVGGSLIVFPYPGRRGGYVDVPQTLKPDEEVSGAVTLAFDPSRQAPLLDQPGRYEFQVIYDDIPSDRGSRIESNVLVVDVGPDPDSEREALAAYSNDLVELAQYEARWSRVPPEVTKHAAEFAERFPISAYAEHVRKGLHRALRDRIAGNRATKEEKELYEKLEALRPPKE
jgi:hypothetical protein